MVRTFKQAQTLIYKRLCLSTVKDEIISYKQKNVKHIFGFFKFSITFKVLYNTIASFPPLSIDFQAFFRNKKRHISGAHVSGNFFKSSIVLILVFTEFSPT